MIHEAAEKLLTKGFENPDRLADQHGTIGYLVERDEQYYVLVAKQYAYQNLASFMAPIIHQVNDDTQLIFYSADDDLFTIFDTVYVKENGNDSQGPSKKRDCRWVEVSREFGVDLDDYLNGRETPRTISGDNESLASFA